MNYLYRVVTDHPQQSISGLHTSEAHLQAHNVELEKEVHRPEFIGRNVTLRRDYKEHRKEKRGRAKGLIITQGIKIQTLNGKMYDKLNRSLLVR